MPVRPIDMQVAIQQTGGAASQQAAARQAPLAAQAHAEATAHDVAARQQATVSRSLKGEVQTVGDHPGERGRRERRKKQQREPQQAESGGARPDEKGRKLDVRF